MIDSPIKILILEDNPADARLIDIMLREVSSMGFNLTRAETLGNALKLLESEKFDVILSDLNLPDSSNLDTIISLYEKDKSTPIVVLTSLDDESVAMESLHRGAQDYVVKGRIEGASFVRSVKYAMERKRLQKEIEGIREEFISILVHDLKSPIASMLGFAELLRDPDYGEISDEKKEYAENIKYSAKILLNMISNIVESSRMELGQFKINAENFKLSELIDELQDTFSSLAIMQKIKLDFNCPSDVEVYADKNKIRQVFHNIISNSFKFTQEAGIISLRVIKEDNAAKVTVADTGSGIPKELYGRIFKKFSQAEGEKRGSGLGLYIVKEILIGHNSKITLDSEEKKGAKFFFSLPLKK